MPAGSSEVARGTALARRRLRWPWILLLTLPLWVGLALTVHNAWVCDDAFISFRYIDQFEHGKGLVYNPGERVEGYTHFLWIVLLAALHRIGFDLVTLGRNLPIVFYAATLAVLFVRAVRRGGAPWQCLPLAAWCVALHLDMQTFGSSGLETAAFTLCMTLTAIAATAERLRPGRVAAASALATLFRPEGLLLSAIVAWFLLWRRCGWHGLRRFAIVWGALVVPLFVWRLVYYGDWLPNTFYAKSASLSSWTQGWHYVRLYFTVYPILALALGVALVGGVRAARRGRPDPILLFAITSLVMILYVWHLGGDFMFARFLLPVTPLLYLALEEALRGRELAVVVGGTAVAVAATALGRIPHERLFPGHTAIHDIVDERKFYPTDAVEKRRRQGEALATLFADVPARFCILGGQAALAYFAHLPYALEEHGLTDRELARRPVDHRGRPGHEKVALEGDLIARHVNFRFRAATDSMPNAVNEVHFYDLRALNVVYDRELMARLKDRPGFKFVDYTQYLDAIVAASDQLTDAQLQDAWTFFRDHYFVFNRDPERLLRVRDMLVARGIDPTKTTSAAAAGDSVGP